MAKSNVGGSRAYLKGRIGSDVYSVGKDGKGKRQQVVRSLAVEVANPRSQAQMFNRMVMSTVMQTVSALAPIIDHSFDGIATGQPNISEFIRRNYTLVKADALAHPASGNSFGLNKYQEKGSNGGAYVVSNGSVVQPSALHSAGGMFQIQLTADTLTVGGLREALGLSADGYFTILYLTKNGGAKYCRLHVDPSLADATVIAAGNVGTLFLEEGNLVITPSLSGNTIELADIADWSDCVSYGLIVSEKVDGAWKHSSCTLSNVDDVSYTSDEALPTYPVGNEQFLNGGDI